jgi:lambda family phage portal protein
MKAPGFFARFRDAWKITASWGWSGGVTSGFKFDGSKMRGALRALYGSGRDLDYDALRERSRAAYWDSTEARALLQRLVSNVINTGLTLECSPLWELLGSSMSDDEKRQFSRNVEQRFWAWASSHEPDATGRRNLTELQEFIFANELRDGEGVCILRYSPSSDRISPLSIQVLDPEQIDGRYTNFIGPDRAGLTVEAASRGNVLRDGLELTPSGEPLAVYLIDPDTRKTTRVPFSGLSGRQFVLMPSILDLPGQVRGTGPLGPVIHELQKSTDYKLYEIESALVNAIIAAYIVPSAGSDTKSKADSVIGGIKDRGSSNTTGNATQEPAEVRVTKPGLFVGSLKKGEDIKSFDTKRPNVNFESFLSAITKSVSASLGIPVEVLEMKFSSNYSASRASLIMFWQNIEKWRAHFVSQLLQPIYEAWFAEEIRAGRISAPGFSASPFLRRAWLSANWIGVSMPSIDPLKDAQADDVRIAQGATTRERVAMKYNGTDFYDNARRLRREADELPPENSTVASSRQAVPGSTEDEIEEEKKQQEGAA